MNRIVLTLLFGICCLGAAAQEPSNNPPEAGQYQQPPKNMHQDPVPQMINEGPPQIEPPANWQDGDQNNYPPNPGRSDYPGNLGEQERELLDKHRENASRGAKATGRSKIKPAPVNAQTKAAAGLLNVDYVDEPILDVLRAIAMAFKLSLIPDKDLGDVKVTIHLENIPVLEGLEKLCKSHGLEMLVDGNVYKVRKTRETAFSLIDVRNKRMNLDVQNRAVKDFLREFVEKTKINIVPDQDLNGLVTGHLKDVEPIDGFKALMEANNYQVRLKNGVYLVSNAESPGGANAGAVRMPRNARYGSAGQGNSDVDVHDGLVTLNLTNASLGDAIREIADQAGMNYTIIGDVSGNVNAQLKGVTVDQALSALLQGTRYAFIRKSGTLLIGDRNPNTPSGQALSGADLVYLKYIKAENIEKLMPKSIPAENIKVIKEQNAVMISGTSDDIATVKSFLDQIDIPTPQVLMEIVVVEYIRTLGSQLGIEKGLSNDKPALNITGSMSGMTQSWSKDGFQATIGIKPPNFELSLRALEAKSKAKILSMPKITTLNGNKAELRVSRTSYYPVSSVNKDGFGTNDFRTIDDGITIELTPWITRHGEVNVNITPTIKTTEHGTEGIPPPVTNRSINTNVSLMDGETIALGGLIKSQEENSRSFVPILGSIPLLGYLFSWRNANTGTQELVIYVTPHILNPDAQSVDLEQEFKSLDRRSGFLKNSDFLKGSKEGAAQRDSMDQERLRVDSIQIQAPVIPSPQANVPLRLITPVKPDTLKR